MNWKDAGELKIISSNERYKQYIGIIFFFSYDLSLFIAFFENWIQL